MKGLQKPSEVQNEQSKDRSQGEEEEEFAIGEAVDTEQNNTWLKEICLKYYEFVMFPCLPVYI